MHTICVVLGAKGRQCRNKRAHKNTCIARQDVLHSTEPCDVDFIIRLRFQFVWLRQPVQRAIM